MSEIIPREAFKIFLLVLFLLSISIISILFLLPISRLDTNSEWIAMTFVSPALLLPTGLKIASEVSNRIRPSKKFFRTQNVVRSGSAEGIIETEEANGYSQNDGLEEFGLDMLPDKWRLAVKIGGRGRPLDCTERNSSKGPSISRSNCSETLPQVNVIVPYRWFTYLFSRQ